MVQTEKLACSLFGVCLEPGRRNNVLAGRPYLLMGCTGQYRFKGGKLFRIH